MIISGEPDLYERGRRIKTSAPMFGGAPQLTFQILDATNGSGGTAVISGAPGGLVTSIYAAPFTGLMASYSFSLVGTITGDGTLAITSPSPLPLGFYLWHAIPSSGQPLVVYQNLSEQSTEEARHMLILDSAVLRIQTLNLPGILPANVYNRWRPRKLQDVEALPRVCVSPVGNITRPGVLSNKDDIGWPFEVNILDKLQADNKANENRNLLWIQKIDQALRNQRLPGAPQAYIVLPAIENATFDLAAFDKNFWSCVLSYRAVTREIRGLS